jgi:two-component system NtrC family sensor kinase
MVDTTRSARQWAWIFTGVFTLVIFLQVAAFGLVQYFGAMQKRYFGTLTIANNQIFLVEQFERASYLAFIALANSDWEQLLQEQLRAQVLAEQFQDAVAALHDGSSAQVGNDDVFVDAITDPEPLAILAEMEARWREAQAVQLRVLRSRNYAITGNAGLTELRALTEGLRGQAQRLMNELSRAYVTDIRMLHHVQTIVPLLGVGAALLLGGLVLRKLVLPLGHTMEALRASRTELQHAHDQLEQRVADRTRELAEANHDLRAAEARLRQSHDELEQRVEERTRDLRDAQRQLVDTALAAGKAEVATNILHNVGNVLNGVNVLAQLIQERLQARSWDGLSKTAALLASQRDDLARFLTEDERGRRLPEYLEQLAARQGADRAGLLESVERLLEHIEHIKRIVVLQQEHARAVSLREDTSLPDVIEDALSINRAGLERHDISIVRDYQVRPRLYLHKHKLLQILINLVSNAKYALSDTPREQRCITVRMTEPETGLVRIDVIDNGCGIPVELLTQIFQHGFTTRTEGHGFGLHASVLAAKDMGGSLHAHSDGPGKGACFTLEIPTEQAPGRAD